MPNYHYPIPEECLPDGTDEEEITGFRLGKSTAATMQDNFVPQYFDPVSSKRPDVRRNPCKYCGASMFTTKEEALEARKICRMKNHDLLIKVRVVCASHGPVKYEPDNERAAAGHFSWYQLAGVRVDSVVVCQAHI